jgi:fructan beta-fructosidase
LRLSINNVDSYKLHFTNGKGEKLEIGYDKAQNRYYIDRANSGRTDFNDQFAKMAYAPRFVNGGKSDLILVMDASSVELFADNGLTVMTSVFFPKAPFEHLQIEKAGGMEILNEIITPLPSIWE